MRMITLYHGRMCNTQLFGVTPHKSQTLICPKWPEISVIAGFVAILVSKICKLVCKIIQCVGHLLVAFSFLHHIILLLILIYCSTYLHHFPFGDKYSNNLILSTSGALWGHNLL